jgi:quercetin dioxygenase-like cupin family protein
VQAWNLRAIEAPDGTRDPVVLHSNDEARAVLIRIEPGGKLGDHQVKERAWVCVVEGAVRVQAGGETLDTATGWLFVFDPDERHSISSEEGARILLLLAPWPGFGHYRGGDLARER